MFSDQVEATSASVLTRLQADLDEVAALGLDTCTDSDVIDLLRGLEVVRNRVAAVEHAVIAQAETRGLAYEAGLKTTAALLRQVQRIGISEARQRTAAAAALGPRRNLTGEVLAPQYPRLSAAQAAGEVSPAAARLITDMIGKLPDEALDNLDPALDLEAELLTHAVAREIDLDGLRQIVRRSAEMTNPDGLFRELAYRDRNRSWRIGVRPDGSSTVTAECTAELTEHLLVAMDALAGPKPSKDPDTGRPIADPRSLHQRQHDAILDLLKLSERAQKLPQVSGVHAAIVVHMSEDAYVSGDGVATTGHGVRIPANTARDWAGDDARTMAILRSKLKPVAAYTHLKRFFGEKQRLVMAARDGGCSFPGCDVKPNWCQSHHVIDYSRSKTTDVEQGTLLCGFHHREFERMGWTCTMTDGLPTWTPPPTVDKQQRPVHNHLHHLAERYTPTRP